jgi:hypothetical protein
VGVRSHALVFTHHHSVGNDFSAPGASASRADLPDRHYFFRFWLWLTTGMVTRNGWASIAHTPSQTPGIRARKRAASIPFWEYRALSHRAKNHETLDKYGQGGPTTG